MASKAGNRNVWSQFKFAPVTTAAIRLWITGALASYSRVTEVEAWGVDGLSNASLGSTQGQDDEGICTPDNLNPCEMMTTLYTAMTNAPRRSTTRDGVKQNWWSNWPARLDWTYSHWRDASGNKKYGSQNLPMMAHAIALWIPSESPGTQATSIQWWKDFLDCQNGAPCNVTDPQTLRFMKGAELLSNTYDAETTTTVLTVRYWALSHNNPELEQKATLYLLYTWGMYSLGAGKAEAKVHFNRYNMNVPIDQKCQPNYNGPFMALAGMRSTPSHTCKDDRSPLFARALQWDLSTSNWKGSQYLTSIYDYLESKLKNQFVNAYGLSQEQRDYCRTVVDPTAVAPARTEADSLANADWLATVFLKDVRTIVPYHFVAWSGQGSVSNQIRLTLMETNRNRNTAATYAVRYDFRSGTDSQARALFPWSDKDSRQRCNKKLGPWRTEISFGYARFLPRVGKPTSLEASSVDGPGLGESASCTHEDFKAIIETMTIPNWGWKYHYVFGPQSPPQRVIREP